MATTLSPESRAAIESKLESEEYASIPFLTRLALKKYIFDRIAPGYALRCLLEGQDPVRAVLNFDGEGFLSLRALCMFLHWDVPSNIFGSKKIVEGWLAGAVPVAPGWRSENPDEVKA